jgi:hypothetical protein
LPDFAMLVSISFYLNEIDFSIYIAHLTPCKS